MVFDPQATGALSATLNFNGTPDQTQPSVNLTGTGVQPVTVTPATLAFGSQGLNSPTNAKTVTVQNNTSSADVFEFQHHRSRWPGLPDRLPGNHLQQHAGSAEQLYDQRVVRSAGHGGAVGNAELHGHT